jgi:hypothetical protein
LALFSETRSEKPFLNIELKAVKQRILDTTPPTNIPHRAALINSAMTPLYSHVFMTLPVEEKDVSSLHKEILSFLREKQ